MHAAARRAAIARRVERSDELNVNDDQQEQSNDEQIIRISNAINDQISTQINQINDVSNEVQEVTINSVDTCQLPLACAAPAAPPPAGRRSGSSREPGRC